jgi:alcohol dehydrogenase class IV
VLAYTQSHSHVPTRPGSQDEILSIFNNALKWQEKSASDAVTRLVRLLGLPSRLSEVGVTSDKQIQKVAELTMTDALAEHGILPPLDGVKEILNMVR